MRLSDSFAAGPGDLEVTATVLNCNEGRNRSIMEACTDLRGYAHLIALERRYRNAGMDYREAARKAVGQCIADGFLAGYLTEHRAEVEDMLFTIQDEERAMEVHRKAIEREAREQGFADGRAEGQAESAHATTLANLRALMKSTASDASTAMGLLGISEEDREEYLAELI